MVFNKFWLYERDTEKQPLNYTISRPYSRYIPPENTRKPKVIGEMGKVYIFENLWYDSPELLS